MARFVCHRGQHFVLREFLEDDVVEDDGARGALPGEVGLQSARGDGGLLHEDVGEGDVRLLHEVHDAGSQGPLGQRFLVEEEPAAIRVQCPGDEEQQCHGHAQHQPPLAQLARQAEHADDERGEGEGRQQLGLDHVIGEGGGRLRGHAVPVLQRVAEPDVHRQVDERHEQVREEGEEHRRAPAGLAPQPVHGVEEGAADRRRPKEAEPPLQPRGGRHGQAVERLDEYAQHEQHQGQVGEGAHCGPDVVGPMEGVNLRQLLGREEGLHGTPRLRRAPPACPARGVTAALRYGARPRRRAPPTRARPPRPPAAGPSPWPGSHACGPRRCSASRCARPSPTCARRC